MQKEEIPFAEIEQYAPEVLCALDKICESPSFRTSPKSCEFLRHIVRHTLLGTVDELKERLIGITLLGRKTTYDTGSDAGVRVRANDVRKRLSTYNADPSSPVELTLDLPVGSYIPRFFRNVETLPVETVPDLSPISGPAFLSRTYEVAEQFKDTPSELGSPPSLSLRQLATPTIAALFLCTICIRWQLAQAHPFVTFWQSVLQDHNAILYVPPVRINGQQNVSMASMNEAAPLLNLAGQFHARFTLADNQIAPSSPTDILVSIGSSSSSSQDRLVIENTPFGREIIDRSQSRQHPALANHAALLTIENGSQRSIRIDGTDDAAIGSFIQALCERDTFPDELADSLQSGTITQMVFSTVPHAETMIFHEPLSAASAMAALGK
jgi:hypothetical protein